MVVHSNSQCNNFKVKIFNHLLCINTFVIMHAQFTLMNGALTYIQAIVSLYWTKVSSQSSSFVFFSLKEEDTLIWIHFWKKHHCWVTRCSTMSNGDVSDTHRATKWKWVTQTKSRFTPYCNIGTSNDYSFGVFSYFENALMRDFLWASHWLFTNKSNQINSIGVPILNKFFYKKIIWECHLKLMAWLLILNLCALWMWTWDLLQFS